MSEGAAPLPFSGVKVVDISNFLAAPMCSMYLADFGAEVIKIERPDKGDEIRYWGHNKEGSASTTRSSIAERNPLRPICALRSGLRP